VPAEQTGGRPAAVTVAMFTEAMFAEPCRKMACIADSLYPQCVYPNCGTQGPGDPLRSYLPSSMRTPHPAGMFVVTEAEAAAIRAVYEQRGVFSAAVELRRLFPAVTDTAQARAYARPSLAGSRYPCHRARESSGIQA
jgi:hypothetical protein